MGYVAESMVGQRSISNMVVCTCKLDCNRPTNWLVGTCDDTDEAIQLAVCPVRREVVGL